MPVLTSQQRKLLDAACVKARSASEQAVRAALSPLAIAAERPPAHLKDEDRQLRRGLRAKSRQLGDQDGNLDLLIAECAYEQWHRLLFARFLAENNLLIHPKYRAPVTLEDCEELSDSLGEPDGWSVASRFAAEILPGIFRLDDPCVQLRLAPEGRLALEGIVDGLPSEVFSCDDSLGWVYQYWQKERKDEVNRSERKIGGADLGPVTQLFTEHYMVRFLLQNSLGAWWAGRHPTSPLVKEWEYLRFDENGRPAAGVFDSWPTSVSDVTVMDPCCGSGHFLVEAFDMLWRMRVEEEGLAPVVAQDAVLRDNLFGLELDARCIQIAIFAVALIAWKRGGGWRELPVPHVSCSGVSAKVGVDEWRALAGGDERIERALIRLHTLFRDAETLGSLINPKGAIELIEETSLQRSFEDVDWEEVAPLLENANWAEAGDPATMVLGTDASGIARAADLLSRQYTLIVTNPPFLGLGRQSEALASFVKVAHPEAKRELALCLFERIQDMLSPHGVAALVLPGEWTYARSGRKYRKRVLDSVGIRLLAKLGASSFLTAIRASPILIVAQSVGVNSPVAVLDVSMLPYEQKPQELASGNITLTMQKQWREAPDCRFIDVDERIRGEQAHFVAIGDLADVRSGMSAGDSARFERYFWEVDPLRAEWEFLQSSPNRTEDFHGRDKVVFWQQECGDMAELAESVKHLNHSAQNWRRGKPLWGRPGVAVSQIGARTSIYGGDCFDSSCFAIVPDDSANVLPLVAFAQSGQLRAELKKVNPTWKLTSPNTLLQLRLDLQHWKEEAARSYPNGLPSPTSSDPTQWLFKGDPVTAVHPTAPGVSVHVAVARLLGYLWPAQFGNDGSIVDDDYDALVDQDGIVCIPSVHGEAPAEDRLQQVLAAGLGKAWSPSKQTELLASAGSKKKHLGEWLRDDFFKQHCVLYGHRPFVWHIWDGHRDGFAALVNYHRLDRNTLEKLTYTYLGDWIERQRAEVLDEKPGSEARLAAASKLRRLLELILEGEPPYDIYVRWKSLGEQPIGWDPDVSDGVRLNVRPFVEAGILRSKFNVKWDKDRGKNPDGSERLNDLHFTNAQKQAARGSG